MYVEQTLSSQQQRWLLQTTSYCLMFSSRLNEALPLTIRALQQAKTDNDWESSIHLARNAAVILASLGNINLAGFYAMQTVEFVSEIDEKHQDYKKLFGIAHIVFGYSLFLQAKLYESQQQFLKVENLLGIKLKLARDWLNIEKAQQAHVMYDVWYCQILLQKLGGSDAEILYQRTKKTFDIVNRKNILRNAPIAYFNHACALASYENKQDIAERVMEEAIEKTRDESNFLFNPIINIGRIAFYRRIKKYQLAQQVLQEAKNIVKHGNIGLFAADIILQEANLLLDIQSENFQEQVEKLYHQASEMIFKMGYTLRFAELELLAARLAYHQRQDAEMHLAKARGYIDRHQQHGLEKVYELVCAEVIEKSSIPSIETVF